MHAMGLTALLALGLSATALTGCTTSRPADVLGLVHVIGDSLPGAQGKTLEDQRRIDQTVARGCGGGVYGTQACARQTAASAARRRELSEGQGE